LIKLERRVEWLAGLEQSVAHNMDEPISRRRSSTTLGFAAAPIRVVAPEQARCTAFISSNARTMDASGCKTRSIESFSNVCEFGLWESISVERDGVYEGMYRSRKYRGGPMSDGIGPIAWSGSEQKTDVGHHHTRDCSGIFNSFSLSITGRPTSS
jgi:hypothetical protein